VGVDYDQLHDDPEEALRRIVGRVADIEDRCDAIVLLGTDYTGVTAPTELAMNGRIAADLGAAVVLVVGGRGDDGARTPHDVAEAAELALAELRREHAGATAVVVNRADPERPAEIAAALERVAPDRPHWVVPEDPLLTAPLLGSLFASAEATLVKGDPALLDRPVLATVVAGMTLDNLLPRLLESSLVVIPGDRSDALLGTLVAQQ